MPGVRLRLEDRALEERYYVRFKGRVLGPMSKDKTIELIRRGQISRMHELSPDGLAWRPAEEFTELFPKKVEPAPQATQQSKAETAPVAQPVEQWYAHIDGQNVGPVDEENLRMLAVSGRLHADSLIWKNGMPEWLAAEVVRPMWFARMGRSQTTDSANDQSSSNLINDFCQEISKRTSWVYLIAVMAVVLSSGQLIAVVAYIFHQFSRPARTGGQAIILFAATLIVFVVIGFQFFNSVLLLRFANSISVLRHAPSDRNLLQSLARLSTFWLFTGILSLAGTVLLVVMLIVDMVNDIEIWS